MRINVSEYYAILVDKIALLTFSQSFYCYFSVIISESAGRIKKV